MRAHLNSRGAGVWEITQDVTYVIPATRVTQDERDKYHANSKAVDILFASLSRAEFDRVEDLSLAHEIWSRLQSFHEGNSQVKARLFETYRREYENFVHLPGESADALFQRFLAIVNKMKANITVLPYTDHDRALKLLHALDHEVWGTKVDAIIESPNYETLSTDELFAKLKSTEVDKRLRAKQGGPTDPNSMALMSGSGQPKSLSNSSSMSFALSSLVSVSEEQLEVLDDDELALITRRFMRFNDNRKNRRRNNNNCFDCGKPGHFAADCPDKNKTKSKYDYNKHKNKDGTKKKKKYTDREKKEYRKKAKARAFIASLSDVDSDTDDHTDSSSSEEDDDRKAKKKDGKNFNGLCFYSDKNRDGYCVMALNSKKDDKESDSDTETEVKSTPEQLALEVEELNDCLINQDKLLKKAAKERVELKAKLESALIEIDMLKSASTVSDVVECDECGVHMASLASLQSKHALLVDELDLTRAALDEVKNRPILLSACKSCPALQVQLDDACAKLSALENSEFIARSKLPECTVCPELKLNLQHVEDENSYLRTVLSWVSSREPQLGMMIQEFKRADGFGLGSVMKGCLFNGLHKFFDGLCEKVGQNSGERKKPSYNQCEPPIDYTPRESPTKNREQPNPACEQNFSECVRDGIFIETPPKAPKKAIWVEKPNHLKNKLDTLPEIAPKKPPPKPQDKPQPRVNPQPKQPARFHCEYCKRWGHLEEFCFRKKKALRREREWGNRDMYHPSHGVHAPRAAPPPRRVDSVRFAPSRVFARHAPRHDQYGSGQYGRGFESRSYNGPRFPPSVGRSPPVRREMVDFDNPTLEQMVRHWYSTCFSNPSVESFAHPWSPFV